MFFYEPLFFLLDIPSFQSLSIGQVVSSQLHLKFQSDGTPLGNRIVLVKWWPYPDINNYIWLLHVWRKKKITHPFHYFFLKECLLKKSFSYFLSPKDKSHIGHGESFAEVISKVSSCSQIVGVGANCIAAENVTALLQGASTSRNGKPFVVYPNAPGEQWIDDRWTIFDCPFFFGGGVVNE